MSGLARRRTHEMAPAGWRLVVVVPAFNEEATIADVIKRIPDAPLGIEDVSVVVVDDGSTDATAELAVEAGALVICHPTNRGVGAAFATGLEQALRLGADVIVNMDADGQFRPEDIPDLIAPICHDEYGFVTCTRFANPDRLPHMPWIKLWGNRMMCRLVNTILGGTRFTDVSCGFRAYSRETALRLNLFGAFTYTQESFIDLAAKRVAMAEVPLVVRGVREHGHSRVASNLVRYALRTSAIMLRAVRDWRPLLFFGSIALVFVVAGSSLLAFVGCWWMATARTTPWTSLITLGGISVVMGAAFSILALIADQIGRSRKIQEQLLYLQRQQAYGTGATTAPLPVPLDSVCVPAGDNQLRNGW